MSEVTSIQAAKTYNGNIISHGGKPENVKLKKILQNTPNEGTPLTVTYPKGTNTSINPGKSLILGINDSKPHTYNCISGEFEAYFWLPFVNVNTQLCLYQNELNKKSIYLTYHCDNVGPDTPFHYTKVTGNVNLNLTKGDVLTISMLNWLSDNANSLVAGDPITSRGTTTTVDDGDGDTIIG
jgi:hypothetical protein